MPHRVNKKFRTIASDAVQGEGSFVKVKNLTISEIMAQTGVTEKSASADPAKLGLVMLDTMIVDWNWVDDDDKPLPIPAENPGTVASLPFQEAQWLLEATGIKGMVDQKN